MAFLFYVGNYAQYECCFKVGVFEDETCFEQVNSLFVTSLKDNIMSLNCFIVYTPQANLFGIMCVSASSKGIVMLSYVWCAIGRSKRLCFLVVKAWKAISNNCLLSKNNTCPSFLVVPLRLRGCFLLQGSSQILINIELVQKT